MLSDGENEGSTLLSMLTYSEVIVIDDITDGSYVLTELLGERERMKMREEHIQTIREACIKANPEIMELKFGCEVETKSDGKMRVITFDISSAVLANLCGTIALPHTDFKILGRPLRLADVLLALEKREGVDLFFGRGVDEQGKQIPVKDLHVNDGFQFASAAIPILLRDWNLRKDTIESQSDETLKLLAGLLASQ